MQKIDNISEIENEYQLIAKLVNQIKQDNKTTEEDNSQAIKHLLSVQEEFKDAIKDQRDFNSEISDEVIELRKRVKELEEETRSQVTVDEEELSKEEEETSESLDSSEIVDGEEFTQDIQCPVCDYVVEEGSSLRSLTNHMAANSNHKDASDFFKEGDIYKCPKCDGKEFDGRENLTMHAHEQHKGLRRMLVDYHVADGDTSSESESDEESLYDEEGNLKIREDRKKRVSDFNKEELEELVYNHLEDQKHAQTQPDLMEDIFDKQYSSTDSEYNRLYNILSNSDKIKRDSSMGRDVVYYTESAQKQEKKDYDVIQSAQDLLGGHEYNHFLNAVRKIMEKKEGDRIDVTYEDFASEYAADPNGDMSEEDVWKRFAYPDNGTLRKALNVEYGGDLSFSVKPRGDTSDKEGKYKRNTVNKWKLVIRR